MHAAIYRQKLQGFKERNDEASLKSEKISLSINVDVRFALILFSSFGIVNKKMLQHVSLLYVIFRHNQLSLFFLVRAAAVCRVPTQMEAGNPVIPLLSPECIMKEERLKSLSIFKKHLE